MGYKMQQDLDDSVRTPTLCPGLLTKGVVAQRSGSGYPEGQTFNHIVAFVCL